MNREISFVAVSPPRGLCDQYAMKVSGERPMTPGAAAWSRLKISPDAIVPGSDQRASRHIEKRNAPVRSAFGSSQLRITLPSGSVATRGEMLPTATGTASSFQEGAPIVCFLHPATLHNEVTPAVPRTPSAVELCSNSLRVKLLRSIAISL